jgi:hypothetical protein
VSVAWVLGLHIIYGSAPPIQSWEEEGEISEIFKSEFYLLFDEISRILYTMIKNLEK